MQRKKFSLSRNRIPVFASLGLAILFFVILLALWFGRPLLGRITQVASPLQPAEAIPTIFVPTPDCGSSTLVLGTATFQIQPLATGPDGTPLVPANIADVAYWVQGTDRNYLFVLSPAPENLSLASAITAESTAKTTWANCNSESYSLSAPEHGSLTSITLPDQSIQGIEIFIQTDVSGNGILFKGELAEEQINTFNTPASGGTEVQAEIGLLETTTSPDSSAVQLTVSIYNFGGMPITLTANDVSLTPPGAEPLEMTKSDPRLPEKVSPAETKNFTFTFPRPVTPTATLRIFTVEYDIEGY